MTRGTPILIAGSGIAGLSLALALARHGISSHILEAAPEPRSEGAGIQLSPNATRQLISLGLGDRLKGKAETPDAIIVRSGKSGRTIVRLPLGQEIWRRHGAPYHVIHRADLQNLLLDTVTEYGSLIRIDHKAEIDSYRQSNDQVSLVTTDGMTYHGSALVGADGLHSRIRGQMLADGPPLFSGYIAWRSLIDARHLLSSPCRESNVDIWLGHKSHLVRYPLRGGKMINLIAIVAEPATANEWQSARETTAPPHTAGHWCPDVRKLFDLSESWHSWPLFDRPPISHFHEKNAILIGDAAHPVLPFLAQGGALAIEDASLLTTYIVRNDGNFQTAFRIFEKARQIRTARIRERSRLQGRIYHLPWPLTCLRDTFMRISGGDRLMAQLDWIHSWKEDTRHNET